MKIKELSSLLINQNGYHKNTLTKERIGALFIYPIDYTPDDCLSCDGYLLDILDYLDLYKVIGSKFNQEGDEVGKFRIPDYNITKRFLQPSDNVGIKINAGLPNITGGNTVVSPYRSTPYGAFDKTTGSQNIHGGGEWYSVSNFDASRSSQIYGASSTVQPPSMTVKIYIKYK